MKSWKWAITDSLLFLLFLLLPSFFILSAFQEIQSPRVNGIVYCIHCSPRRHVTASLGFESSSARHSPSSSFKDANAKDAWIVRMHVMHGLASVENHANSLRHSFFFPTAVVMKCHDISHG